VITARVESENVSGYSLSKGGIIPNFLIRRSGNTYKRAESSLNIPTTLNSLVPPTTKERLELLKKPSLDFLWLKITNRCNEQCAHCLARSSLFGTHGEMQDTDWEKVLQTAKKMNVKMVQFFGGEPTTHPNLNHFIRYAYLLGLNIEVYTNLVRLTDDTLQTFKDL